MTRIARSSMNDIAIILRTQQRTVHNRYPSQSRILNFVTTKYLIYWEPNA